MPLLENIVKPLARRVGTFSAGAFGGVVAMSPDQLVQLDMAITAIILIGVDLALSRFNKNGLKS